LALTESPNACARTISADSGFVKNEKKELGKISFLNFLAGAAFSLHRKM